MSRDSLRCAGEFARLFPAVYLAFHRRDPPRAELPNASRAVLQHLAMTGPLTVGEMAKHLSRAQSVVSEIVNHLERDGFLERLRDSRDHRRVLVWLSPRGEIALAQANEVLSSSLLERAMEHMRPVDRQALIQGMQALCAASEPVSRNRRPRRKS